MLTVEAFRKLALTLPHAAEKPHFDRASFRVDAKRGKIFATMLEADQSANVFLTPDEQAMLVESEPGIFFRVANKWGDKGATTMRLGEVDETTALSALRMSWYHAAPAALHPLLG